MTYKGYHITTSRTRSKVFNDWKMQVLYVGNVVTSARGDSQKELRQYAKEFIDSIENGEKPDILNDIRKAFEEVRLIKAGKAQPTTLKMLFNKIDKENKLERKKLLKKYNLREIGKEKSTSTGKHSGH